MGLLDGLGSIIGDVLQGKQVNLVAIAEQALVSSGGMNGILAQLQQAGLGDQVSSWLGQGSNLPISADQIKAALSSDQLQNLANAFGVHIDHVPELLAQHLPAAVDQASPDGMLPSP
jgi:uncharacterized protein YidB (DUF937 family)